jgi:hypothetical protein
MAQWTTQIVLFAQEEGFLRPLIHALTVSLGAPNRDATWATEAFNRSRISSTMDRISEGEG